MNGGVLFLSVRYEGGCINPEHEVWVYSINHEYEGWGGGRNIRADLSPEAG